MDSAILRVTIPWLPVLGGAACWALVTQGSMVLAAPAACLALGALLSAWLILPEERTTAGLRISMYAGSVLAASGVLQVFWGLWGSYIAWSGWHSLLAIPGALVAVHERSGALLKVVPWVAACVAFFGVYFALAVGVGLAFGTGAGERGRRRSESELFGRSRLMGRRMMRRMGREGGIILGAMDRGLRSELVRYPLEGAAVTIAPPRTGKTALIMANLLAGERGGLFMGSNLIMDPRGEIFMVTAQRRKDLERNVVLVDPFGEVEKMATEYAGRVKVPTTESVTFNPMDFIREGPDGIKDIRVLLDGLLTPPARQGADNSRHFYESARALLSAIVAWVKWMRESQKQDEAPFAVVRHFVNPSEDEKEAMKRKIESNPGFAFGLPKDGLERMEKVAGPEAGSNFSTIANQLDWLQMPALAHSTAQSTFVPDTMADGNTDVYLVVPEDMLDPAKPWVRMWIVAVCAVAERQRRHKGLTIVLDEMPRLGFLKPVMDCFNMAAGRGIRFWCFIQSISTLDKEWQKENREVILDLAEVVQALGLPRMNPELADRFSKAVGHATFVNTSRSDQGTVAGGDVLRREQSSQSGTSRALVKERVMTADDLMMLSGDEQIVLTNSKTTGREAMRLYITRYWKRRDLDKFAGANPYVLRKQPKKAAA